MRGSGYWSFLDSLLRPQKSTQSWSEPSFFFYKQDRGCMGGRCRTDEAEVEVFINEGSESFELDRGERV